MWSALVSNEIKFHAAQQNFDILERYHFLQFSERSKRNIKHKVHEIMSQVSKLKKVKN